MTTQLRTTRSTRSTKPLKELGQTSSSSSSGFDRSSITPPLIKVASSIKSASPTKSIPPAQPMQPPWQSLIPVLPPQQQQQPPPQSPISPPQLSSTKTQPSSSHKPPPVINYNHEQQQLTQIGNQLSVKLHQLATIYKTKATKYKAITTYQSLELEKRKIITTTSTMLKLESNHDTIQQIISDSNALLFPMSLKQHYLKLHIAQIVNQEKELEVIRASLVKLHQQFVSVESLLNNSTFEK